MRPYLLPLLLLLSWVHAQSFERSVAAPAFSIEPAIRSGQLEQATGSAFVLTNSTIGALGDSDLLLLKLDAAGNIIHQLRLGDTGGMGYHDVGTEAVELGGGLYICGYTRSIDTASPPTFTSFLLRTDTALTLQWQKNYLLPGPMELYANSMATTANGQLLLAGQLFDGADFHTVLMKVAANGNTIWIRRYEIPFGERVRCVRELPNGEILLCGNVVFGFELALPFAFKVDANGGFVWGRYYNYPPSSPAEQSDLLFVHAQSLADILLCGHTDVVGASAEDLYVVDIDSSGAVNWARTYGGSQFEMPSAVHFDAVSNEVVMLGNSSSFNGSFAPLPLALGISPSGTLLHAALFGDTANTELALLDHYQRVASDRIVLSGWRGFPNDDRYLAGVDNDLMNTCHAFPVTPVVSAQVCGTGVFTAVVSQPDVLQNDLGFGVFSFSGDSLLCATTTSVLEIPPAGGLFLSPDPADEFTELHSSGGFFPSDRITLTDVEGRVVRSLHPSGEVLRIRRDGLPSGVYHVVLTQSNGARATARLLFH